MPFSPLLLHYLLQPLQLACQPGEIPRQSVGLGGRQDGDLIAHPASLARYDGAVADDEAGSKPESPPPQAKAPEGDDFVTKLRAALPPLLDELLDLKGDPEPAPKSKTLRETEESVRDQVARAVRELEEESRKTRDAAAPPAAPPAPPKEETKPWRERFWG